MHITGSQPSIFRMMIKKIALFTAGSVVLSLLVTASIMYLIGAGAGGMQLALAIAAFCPLLVTPPATFVFYRQTLELEAAHNALHEAHKDLFAIHAELKAAHKNLEHRANHDGMTGLANRDAFLEHLSAIIESSGRGYLLMIDADRFKQINDDHGHDAGDRALLAVADAISGSIRTVDFSARIGGEEFAIILGGASSEDARVIAERVRVNVQKMTITTADGAQLKVTVSIGGAAFGPQSRTKDIMRAADSRLYDAKHNGRNLVCIDSKATRAA
ncbi:MAG: GGDEF domain-containing protein [Hoeflea sp.]|uniref:GGDEF domain-containing protein n=1 Tax=Hoeflea sp. TaxID=1940281 RepID=UPI001DFCD641|nr:GGDEF domain-containing protein [Hoeflea sp.]MBU4531396.1 GGDEF domain-containing protein [Alphaproteobacteria bacterium]MBU4544253.1 GGDEF domain-containing protein [Alphaproteobacteria bacterium]MBU4550510.1 GGDEF domain-containing protein [Alphaproteobacteria bacterium]MBV1724672.1 GGDEF domain-containing protein [Hoeflea sp.]MBV1760692.1 GGDEF domain-containing protein [Hoeflea sp.]